MTEKCSTDQHHNNSTIRPNPHILTPLPRPSLDPSMKVTCLPSPNDSEEQYYQHHHHSYPLHVSQAFAESAYFNNSTCRTIGCRECHNNNELLSSLSTAMHSGRRYQSPLPLHPHHQTRHLDHVFTTPITVNNKGKNIIFFIYSHLKECNYNTNKSTMLCFLFILIFIGFFYNLMFIIYYICFRFFR